MDDIYYIFKCPECGVIFTEAYPSHGKRGDYPPGRRPQCDGALEPVEVVPRSEVAPFVGDATHPDWVPYVAGNLLAALQTVPDTGDWHAAVRSWCEQHIDGPPEKE